MSVHTHLTAISTALFMLASPLCAAETLPDAGLLNKEIEQGQRAPKIKPGGSLFHAQRQTQPQSADDGIHFQLREIQVIGLNGEPVEEDIRPVITPFLHQDLQFSALDRLTRQLTEFYRRHDYLLARAILPPQDIVDGKLTVLLIKGQLADIHINNHSALRDNIVKRLSTAGINEGYYVYQSELERLALVLNDIPAIRPSLSLKSAQQQGKADLTVTLENGRRFGGYVLTDNQGSKETGRYRFLLGGSVYNLLGLGDELKLDMLTSGKGDLKNAKLDYSALIDGYATRFGVTASYLHYRLGGNFKDLQSAGNAKNAGVYLLHPTVRSPNLRLNTRLAFNHQTLTDKQRAVNLIQTRKINTLSLTLAGSWNSVPNGVSYFSFGTVFGREGSHSNERPHYRAENFAAKKSFTLFNYQLSHEQFLPYSLAVNINAMGQWTDKNLDSSQKLLLGGLHAVRGYKAGAASVDEGHIVQAELKHYVPVFEQSILTGSLFYDYATGKYYKSTRTLSKNTDNHVTLQSLGAGLALSAANNYHIGLTFAKPINNKLAASDRHQVWLSAMKTF
ncbi:ShlB/FhaC/HecB family hemolysin secretion/activation protein [Necropsobacter rosorum]|uniref:ShlB/FhaC/HecB family hemolysin secretion/activation protein n=1 Tax=Necropsobacter rosorum TaxID=908285 RepID=UPI000509D91A